MEPSGTEREVGALLRQELDMIAPPGADYGAVARRSRWLSRRRSAAGVLFAGMTVLVAWAAAAGWPDTSATKRSDGGIRIQPAAEPTPSDGWSTHRNEEHGYSVSYPQDWRETDASTLSSVMEPEPILALGTKEMSPGSDCGPTGALRDLGPEDAAIFVSEVNGGNPADFADRPATIGPSDFTGLALIECYVEPVRLFSFQDQGRMLTAVVAPGESISPERRDDLWRIVNSLEFDPVPAP